MYVYRQTEKELWTVGFYDPKGLWQPESDHSTGLEAAARVSYLNGKLIEKQGKVIHYTCIPECSELSSRSLQYVVSFDAIAEAIDTAEREGCKPTDIVVLMKADVGCLYGLPVKLKLIE